MVTRVYRVTQAGGLEPLSGDVRAAVRERDGVCWIDVPSVASADLAGWLDILSVPDIVRRVMPDTETTWAVALANAAYFAFPFPQAGVTSRPRQIMGICVDRALLTFHDGPLDALESVWGQIDGAEFLAAPSVGGVVCGLCALAARWSQARGWELRRQVSRLTERIDRGDDEIAIDEILESEAAVETLAAMVEEQLFCFQRLKSAHSPALNLVEIASDFDLPVSSLHYVDRTIDRLEQRVRGLRNRYEMLIGEKTNRRLAFLTIISAVFLPLTLIAGIYGMNFKKMPGLDLAFGYPLALSFMALVTAGMIWFFWKKGWFE
jgi:magnesium transporter